MCPRRHPNTPPARRPARPPTHVHPRALKTHTARTGDAAGPLKTRDRRLNTRKSAGSLEAERDSVMSPSTTRDGSAVCASTQWYSPCTRVFSLLVTECAQGGTTGVHKFGCTFSRVQSEHSDGGPNMCSQISTTKETSVGHTRLTGLCGRTVQT